ncbi:ABC transporter ATP-binding protein [Plantactinospora mayteni]|uniref:Multidrug ABC transporter permease n=1 Tax=Plantactinospora mayteni TaxID=566021 RepID=A0ABQ4ELD6_9ACTN|nr:ABC transporter ATP-binding protein [Plantactinospora mayteni]GIG95563.1 multidrug ABC transporter permease [Plantactinospora mayteni]
MMPSGSVHHDAGTGPVRRPLLATAATASGLAWGAARGGVLLLGVAAVVGGVAPVLVAWLTRAVLDGVGGGALVSELVILGAALALTGVLVAVLPQFEQFLRAEVDRAASRLGMERLHAAVDRLVGLGRFEDPHFLDRLRLAGDSVRSPAEIVEAKLAVARGLLVLAGFLGSLLLLSPVMALVVVVAAVPTLLAELALSRRRVGMTVDITPAERRELFYNDLLTSVAAAKEVRLFGAGAFLRARMMTERRTADRARRATDRRELFAQGGLAVLAAVVAGGGLVWAVRSAHTRALSVGDVSLFILAVAGVQGALGTVISALAWAHQRLLLIDHYRAVLTAEPDLPTPSVPRPVPPLRHGIELRDVWFRYSDDHPWVLSGVNLTIPAGTSTALVGRNGAGKSTLVKLLCRFYDPTRGAVLWDGVDLRELDPRQLRERITAVFQDFVEYDLSAGENIGIGDVGRIGDPDRIHLAARRAGIHADLVALPYGYDTLLSRMFMTETDRSDPRTGVVLSGGQWQRLALARAFVRDARDLMILDEPSAGLDAAAEYEVHAGLRQHRVGRTSVLISHRLGAVRDADSIVVLDAGVVTERGRHPELLAAEGTYATLFRLQAAGYTGEDDAPEPERPMDVVP